VLACTRMNLPVAGGFCRQLSVAHHESIVASAASDTWFWIVLEYGGPWAAKAYDRATMIPLEVRHAIDGWVAQVPGSRVQLIRRRSTQIHGETQVLLAWSKMEHPIVRRFRLPDIADVPSLDVPGFVAAVSRGDDPAMGEPPDRPVVLVCTNGKRDRCCAKWGVPVYRALSHRDDVDVWQTTHLGGHRFAATLLTLPDGLCHGRIEPEESDALVQALHERRIHRLDRFRGRTSLSAPGQAGEHFFRQASGRTEVDALRSVRVATVPGGWLVRLLDDAGVDHSIAVARETLSETAPPSCGKAPEPIHRWTRSSLVPT
jgi:hypothetical protein